MASKPTIGKLIDQLYTVKQEIADHNKVGKDLKAKYDQIELQIMAAMQEQDTTQGRGTQAQATVNDQHYPEVEDWDKFYQYIHDNRFYHLLQRRPSSPACNELLAANGTIPGVVRFTKKVVNLRGI